MNFSEVSLVKSKLVILSVAWATRNGKLISRTSYPQPMTSTLRACLPYGKMFTLPILSFWPPSESSLAVVLLVGPSVT